MVGLFASKYSLTKVNIRIDHSELFLQGNVAVILCIHIFLDDLKLNMDIRDEANCYDY